MGTGMGRIEQEFLIENIIEKNMPVELHYKKLKINGVFLSSDGNGLLFSSSDSSISNVAPGERVSFFFSFYSHTMTFVSKVIKEGNPVKITMPDKIYKNLKRKFVRVSAGTDIQISFTMDNARIVLDFPKTQEYESLGTDIYSDDFDLSNLKELYAQFNARASSFATNYEIIMLREKKPQTFEELIITDTGKSLLIPNTRDPLPDKTMINSEYVISKEMFLDKHGDEKVSHGKNLRQIDMLLKEKHEKGILAELYTPVIYHEYAIGYIHLFNKISNQRLFNNKTLDFTREISRVLAFALEKQGYFSGGELQESVYEPEIMDISAAGILFTHPEKKLSELLGMYGDLKLILKIGPRKMEILSRVMRKYKTGNIYFYGIQFLEVEPENFRFLFDYVYGRPFSEVDDHLWEGGTAPPELKF